MPRIHKTARQDNPLPARFGLRVADPALPAVLIHRDVLSEMYSHALRGYPNEIGGYYVGLPLVDVETGVRATYVEQSVEAITTGTRTHVTMHPESFEEVIRLCEHTGTIVVGYYHSHPGLSVFQSGTDTTYFRDYHQEPYQIAIVVDPTLTTNDDLDPSGEWIGFFAWDQHRHPTLLPSGNIIVVSERPTLLDQPPMAEQPQAEAQRIRTKVQTSTAHGPVEGPLLETPAISQSEARELAQIIWHATQLLNGKLHHFDPALPILLISRELLDELDSVASAESPPYGVLEGAMLDVAGYNFICVMGSTSSDAETLLMYSDRIARTKRNAVARHLMKWGSLPNSVPLWQIPISLQGMKAVGIEGDEKHLLQSRLLVSRKPFSTRPWSEQSSALARSCGNYCLLIVRRSATAAQTTDRGFKVLYNKEGRVIDLPASNIMVL